MHTRHIPHTCYIYQLWKITVQHVTRVCNSKSVWFLHSPLGWQRQSAVNMSKETYIPAKHSHCWLSTSSYIQTASIETMRELHTLTVVNSCMQQSRNGLHDQNVYGNANTCACQKRGIVVMILYKLLTWYCCNLSQAAGCRSWFVGMNLHGNGVLHNMWSVVCKVDFKRIRGGWGCDHWGWHCDCGCVWCSGTCQENGKRTQS